MWPPKPPVVATVLLLDEVLVSAGRDAKPPPLVCAAWSLGAHPMAIEMTRDALSEQVPPARLTVDLPRRTPTPSSRGGLRNARG